MTMRRRALALALLVTAVTLGSLAAALGGAEWRSGPVAADEPSAASALAPQAAPDLEPAAKRRSAPRPRAVRRAKAARSTAPEATTPVRPVRVRIPRIDVDAAVVDLGLNDDGTLEVPTDYGQAGWYTGRSAPGDPGPSVVVGHVDSLTGPAVFLRLNELKKGDLIAITRSDGRVAWFRTHQATLVDKDEFPTTRVYGPREEPVLRLITCGGGFDSAERSYLGNLIVYAQHLGNRRRGAGPPRRV